LSDTGLEQVSNTLLSVIPGNKDFVKGFDFFKEKSSRLKPDPEIHMKAAVDFSRVD
jgi:hypothetical protein